ncbi:unnamed protein product [Aphanomyces euteiches]
MSERRSGRRHRKPTSGLTNLNRDRWKYLAAVDDIPISTSKRSHKKLPVVVEAKSNQPEAVDIDGDGVIDVREMRMAKYLHEITSKMKKSDGQAPSEDELHDIRVTVGRYTIAQEFIQRNKGKLWRYGPTFADKSEDECVRFIAEHKHFKKIVPYLEFMERRRGLQSSGHLRSCLTETNELGEASEPSEPLPQTWLYTQRKVKTPTRMKMLAVHKAVNSKYESHLTEPDDPIPFTLEGLDEEVPPPVKKTLPSVPKPVFQNDFGVIDIDGDGVIDDFEMQLHVMLQESEAHKLEAVDLNGDGVIDTEEIMQNERAKQSKLQAEGRYLMAKDFVKRNSGDMWLYNTAYLNKSDDEVIDLLANNKGVFSKTMNHLRAKERVLLLKSSKGVTGCLVDPMELKYRPDPANILTPRQVKSKTELEIAQRDFSKNLNSHGSEGKRVFVKNLRLDALQQHEQPKRGLGRSRSTPVVGLPKLYASPIKLATVQEFRITKWKTGDAQK